MEIYCSLRIRTKSKVEIVNKIMKKKSHTKYDNSWSIDINATKKKSYWEVLNTLIDLVENKIPALQLEGIQKDDVTLWLICGFSGQCNLEFNPKTLERIGNNGITFCISCY